MLRPSMRRGAPIRARPLRLVCPTASSVSAMLFDMLSLSNFPITRILARVKPHAHACAAHTQSKRAHCKRASCYDTLHHVLLPTPCIATCARTRTQSGYANLKSRTPHTPPTLSHAFAHTWARSHTFPHMGALTHAGTLTRSHAHTHQTCTRRCT
jgi:hypothetical protein